MSLPSYDDKAGPYFAQQRPEMLAFVPAQARRVLELGCGEAAFAALLRQQRGLHVTAVEPHGPAAAQAATRVDRLLQMPVEQALCELAAQRFDCVVMNDVLEHLVDPWDVLGRLRPLLAPGGVLVASVPNLRYLPVLKDLLLRGQWRYQDDGVLDRTHLRFFTQRSLADALAAAGFAVQCMQGIHPIGVSWKFRLLDRLLRGALDDTRYRQFACVATARPATP